LLRACPLGYHLPCRCLRHPHLARIDRILLKGDIYIVEEHTSHGTLEGLLVSLEKRTISNSDAFWRARSALARYVHQQLVIIVEFCHALGIHSLNISRRNILITWASSNNLLIKLRPAFVGGKAGEYLDWRGTETGGVLDQEARAVEAGKRADIYSIGLLLMDKLCGIHWNRPDENSLANDGDPKALRSGNDRPTIWRWPKGKHPLFAVCCSCFGHAAVAVSKILTDACSLCSPTIGNPLNSVIVVLRARRSG
jgi:hypothetical protein